MKSQVPKVLHPVCGIPILGHVLQLPESLRMTRIAVVAGHQKEAVTAFVGGRASLVEQKERRGSGHALLQTQETLKSFPENVLVLCGDAPLLHVATLNHFIEEYRRQNAAAAVLTSEVEDPEHYGRIVRNKNGQVEAIVEHNNATPEQKKIREINVGAYCFNKSLLFDALKGLKPDAKKQEYYLTDVMAILAKHRPVVAVMTKDSQEGFGINSREDLASAEETMRMRIVKRWMAEGVTFKDPRTAYIDANVELGQDTVIHPNTVIEGPTKIGKRCQIGPFARIRGGVTIGDDVTVGNFVEIVRSEIGDKTLVKHLTYLGDTKVESDVNIGAGTITANFDGKNKHQTFIGKGAQVGSGTVFVAPATLGKNAKTGAGAVLTKGQQVSEGETVVGVPARALKKRKNA